MQLQILITLFKNLDPLKDAGKEHHDAKSVSASPQELKQSSEAHLAILTPCESDQVMTKSITADLVQDDLIELGLFELLNCIFQRNFRQEIDLEAKLTGLLLNFFLFWPPQLNFDLIADTKLVFDVVRASHATEVTTTNHNAELCRQCLGFVHRVSCQEDS